ncbi:MAG: adenylyltransferase/cytidyltransferase family protein [Candidatus Andersenbacteria bacterium]|nr:adenylyltransferase/cytidyltransferase family protein [bacterium]MDZ4225726.1 adenylyltransferase/cytidyltransferase family protein [Candidatus Andersenbacteria bacterium]
MDDKTKHNWRYDKILSLEEGGRRAEELRVSGKKIVTVNGSFDLLHAGHLDFLEEAKRQGDVLFIGLNSDKSVREGKGESRPYIPEDERAAMLAALESVDYVVIVDRLYDEVAQTLIRLIKPQVHVNGSEYGEPETWIEWPVMEEVGAQGYTVKRRPGLATSDIVKKIKEES